MEHLAWPGAALVFCIVFIFVFKQPITKLINRVRKVGREGISTDALEKGDQNPADASGAPTAGELRYLGGLLETFNNTLLSHQEKVLRDELDKRNVNPEDREKVLLRHYAALQIVFSFEKTYVSIFGSQISALQYLNTQQAVARPLLKLYYDEAAKAEQKFYANYAFDQWLGFIQNASFITEADGKVSISLEGIEFLKYILERGYNPHKPG